MKRARTIIGLADVPLSFKWCQSLLGLPETAPAHDYFGQIVLLCLHAWGAHERPSLTGPHYARGSIMKKMRSHLAASAMLLVASAGSVAWAECNVDTVAFFPDRNDTVHIRTVTDVVSFCDNSFREGPGYKFTDVSVAQPPKNGLIATIGPNHFAYHALPDYHGPDQYTIRACAVVGKRRGCSTLIYEVTVR
jgi:hypothetical protein